MQGSVLDFNIDEHVLRLTVAYKRVELNAVLSESSTTSKTRRDRWTYGLWQRGSVMIVSKVTVPNQSAMLSRRCVGLMYELLCACAFLRLKCARARTKAASLEGFLLQRRHSRPNLWSDDSIVSRMCILTSDVHTDLVVRRYVEIYAREPSSALAAGSSNFKPYYLTLQTVFTKYVPLCLLLN